MTGPNSGDGLRVRGAQMASDPEKSSHTTGKKKVENWAVAKERNGAFSPLHGNSSAATKEDLLSTRMASALSQGGRRQSVKRQQEIPVAEAIIIPGHSLAGSIHSDGRILRPKLSAYLAKVPS